MLNEVDHGDQVFDGTVPFYVQRFWLEQIACETMVCVRVVIILKAVLGKYFSFSLSFDNVSRKSGM